MKIKNLLLVGLSVAAMAVAGLALTPQSARSPLKIG
jgi:hypothetical protein